MLAEGKKGYIELKHHVQLKESIVRAIQKWRKILNTKIPNKFSL